MKMFQTTTWQIPATFGHDWPCQQTGFYLLLRDLEIKRNINKLKYVNTLTSGKQRENTKWPKKRLQCSRSDPEAGWFIRYDLLALSVGSGSIASRNDHFTCYVPWLQRAFLEIPNMGEIPRAHVPISKDKFSRPIYIYFLKELVKRIWLSIKAFHISWSFC